LEELLKDEEKIPRSNSARAHLKVLAQNCRDYFPPTDQGLEAVRERVRDALGKYECKFYIVQPQNVTDKDKTFEIDSARSI